MLLVTYVSKTKNWCLAYYMYIVVEKFGHMKICLNVERASIHLVQVLQGRTLGILSKTVIVMVVSIPSPGLWNTIATSLKYSKRTL